MADLELLGVSKVFPSGTKAVDRLDLLVRDGELLVLVGPSGSGKTTTLRLIAGLEQPTSGKIAIGQRDVTALPPRERDVAMVFQDLGLYGHLSAYENLAFGLRLRQKGVWAAAGSSERLSASQIDERVRQAASLLGITPLLDRKPAELSGGQQQRVALGRAIVRRPQAMLMDEPLASLDVPTRRELRRELKRLHRELGITSIYVTHDQAEAMSLGDRIAVIDGGRLEQIGKPKDLYWRPATRFVAEFFGPQGMNWMEGALKHEGRITTFQADGWPLALPVEHSSDVPAGRVVCGYRPEDVECDGGELTGGEVTGEIESWEMLDDMAYVHVKCIRNGHDAPLRITYRQPTSWEHGPPAPGTAVSLRFRTDRLHWFDPATGQRL